MLCEPSQISSYQSTLPTAKVDPAFYSLVSTTVAAVDVGEKDVPFALNLWLGLGDTHRGEDNTLLKNVNNIKVFI